MKSRYFVRLSHCVYFTMLLISSSPAVAGSVHLGLGFSSASVRNDVNGVDNSSGGYALALGWEFADT